MRHGAHHLHGVQPQALGDQQRLGGGQGVQRGQVVGDQLHPRCLAERVQQGDVLGHRGQQGGALGEVPCVAAEQDGGRAGADRRRRADDLGVQQAGSTACGVLAGTLLGGGMVPAQAEDDVAAAELRGQRADGGVQRGVVRQGEHQGFAVFGEQPDALDHLAAAAGEVRGGLRTGAEDHVAGIHEPVGEGLGTAGLSHDADFHGRCIRGGGQAWLRVIASV